MLGETRSEPHVFRAKIQRSDRQGRLASLWLEMSTASIPQPGQFVQIKTTGEHLDPLLCRPLSIADVEPESGYWRLLIQSVGRGTRALIDVPVGSDVVGFGPLGRGFPLSAAGPRPLLLGGGIGAAPLLLLARRLREQGVATQAIVGALDAMSLIGEAELTQFGVNWMCCTDDGSKGYHGRVTDALDAAYQDDLPSCIYACGPTPMLQALQQWVSDDRRAQLPVYASFEAHMACGVGACLGCAIPMATPTEDKAYLRVCRDGPVFLLNEVELR